MTSESPTVVPIGNNQTLIWGMTVRERTRRIARMHKLPFAEEAEGNGCGLLVNSAHVFDPAWLKIMAKRPGEALTLGGVPVIAHCRDAAQCALAAAAMQAEAPLVQEAGFTITAHEDAAGMVNEELRKREQPFALRLTKATLRDAERASYFGAYKGVTDLLTKYLWPEWALVLTRICAKLGITPNMVSSLGATLCIVAMILFWYGHYWAGMATGLVFMVLDTVDGKLARCTITSSPWGHILDHGVDLIHPPFWWYAWGVGLAAYGRPLTNTTFAWVMIVIMAGYVVQRLIEGAFIKWFGGIHIHVWQKIDSDFRLITARRNPNMVILFFATLVGRPDTGLVLVAWWTGLSCLFHLVRLAQAAAASARGVPVRSWLG